MSPDPPATFPARWFGPAAPVGAAAEAAAGPAGLAIRRADDVHTWPWEGVRLARPVRRGETVNLERIGTKEVLVVSDPAILDAIRRASPDHAARFPRASDRPFLARAALLVGPLVLGAFLLVRLGIPALATSLARSVPAEWEDRFGESVIAEVAPEADRIRDRAVTDPLERILERLATAAPSDYRLRVVVVDRPEVNALAAPGGHIAVFRGLLEEVGSPEEVAAVLAHEIEHVRRRHVTEGLFKRASIGLLVSLLAADAGGPAAAGLQLARGLGELAYSREAELEADAGGLATLAAARIPLDALPAFLARMPAGSRVPQWAGFLSTHPADATRDARVRERIAAMAQVPPEPLLAGPEWEALRAALRARATSPPNAP